MNTCAELRLLCDEWLAGELDAAAAGRVEQHLTECDECRRWFAGQESLQSGLTALSHAAERLADQPIRTLAMPRPRRLPLMRIAAAMLVMAGAAAWIVWRDTCRGPAEIEVVERQRPLTIIPPPDAPAAPVRADKPNTVRPPARVAAVGRWSVPVESKRPGVQIVWLYESKELHAAAGDEPASREVR